MALHTKKLYYRRAGITYSADLYTTTTEVGVDYLALKDGSINVYAKLGDVGGSGEGFIRAKKNGIIKSLYTSAVAPAFIGNALDFDAGNTNSYPGSGTVWYDLTSNNNDATLLNGPTYSTAGGGSFTFDGTNDYAYIPTVTSSLQPGVSDFALEIWFNPAVDPPYNHGSWLYGQAEIGNMGFSLMIQNGRMLTGAADHVTVLLNAGTTFNLNAWNYAVFTRHLGVTRVYMNKVGGATSSVVPNLTYSWLPTIGYPDYTALGTATAFNGKISTIRLSKGIGMSATDVTNSYEAVKARYGL